MVIIITISGRVLSNRVTANMQLSVDELAIVCVCVCVCVCARAFECEKREDLMHHF